MVTNWLITGGCGFLGTSLIRRLLLNPKSHNIRVIDNLITGSKRELSLVSNFRQLSIDDLPKNLNGVEFLKGDILDKELALKVSKGVDIIVHLAANTGVGPSVEFPREDCFTNVIGTFNYLEAARLNKIPKFIFASSGAPAGEVEPPIHEELPPHPVSPYGASKLAGEGYCSAYFKTFGISTIVLRFGNVYGPGSKNKSSVVAKFIRKAIEGEVLKIYGDGLQTRDFIYIDDLIDALILASLKPEAGGEVFQIASHHETTIQELTTKILLELKDRGFKNISIDYTENRKGDVRRNFSDTSKAQRILCWTPKVTLDNGIKNTIKYFLQDRK